MQKTAAVLATIFVHAAAVSRDPPGPPIGQQQPGGVIVAQPIPTTYGLCATPQSAADFPSKPIPVSVNNCIHSQTFTSTAPTASYGGPACGGYVVAFGPKGSLDPRLSEHIQLTADWADTPLTATTCAASQLAAVAWGEKCAGPICAPGGFELIDGSPAARKGTWNAISKACSIELKFNSSSTPYRTLSIDAIATQFNAKNKAVRKRVTATIYASHGDGNCIGSSQKK